MPVSLRARHRLVGVRIRRSPEHPAWRNDRTEAAIGYIDLQTGNGGIVFVNTTQGVLLWPKIVEVVDDEQQFTLMFNHVIDKFLE